MMYGLLVVWPFPTSVAKAESFRGSCGTTEVVPSRHEFRAPQLRVQALLNLVCDERTFLANSEVLAAAFTFE